MTHTIKIEKSYADAILEGRKNFEVRYNDRGYNTGDLVRFLVIENNKYVVHDLSNNVYRITYVHSGLGLQEGYVVFGIELSEDESKPTPKSEKFNFKYYYDEDYDYYRGYRDALKNDCYLRELF